MSLSVGIIGLPNVGKSTFFNAILKRQKAFVANYPFATIEPNVGIVEVIDKRLDKLAELVQKNEGIKPPIVYSAIEFVDIAGLVEGASKGEGLGNQFLANIREVDLIIQMVRDFSDSTIIREHSKNPDTDTDIINNEMLIKDLESVEKKLKTVGNDPKKQKEKEILSIYFEHLNKGKFAYELRGNVDKNDYESYIKTLFLLTDKKMIYVFNLDENDQRLKDSYNMVIPAKAGIYSNFLDPPITCLPSGTESEDDILCYSEAPRIYKNYPSIYVSAKLESELASLSEDEQKAYLDGIGIAESCLDKIAKMCFESLELISYFTAGVKEVKAWQIKKGINAQKAAGVIHTDFEKNFIKAEVIAYEDYIQLSSKLACKEAGKMRLEGKEYIVKDADVIEFKVGA